MFHHFLITRFNLRNPKWDVTKNSESLLTDEWMSHRMWLFENFCLPSVLAQKNKNFKWLIFFDVSTAEQFKSQAMALTGAHPQISIFFIDGMQSFYPEIKKQLPSPAESEFIITSRIDNDDCIHDDFIDEIQKRFNSQPYMAVDILKGYSLQVSPTFMLGKKEHIFNPFISLIEKNHDPKTVWFSDHNMWKKESRIIRITDKRLWMSIIHHKNKVNEFDGYDDVKWEAVRKHFKVSDELQSKIATEIIPHKQWKSLSFRNRMYVKMVLFSKLLKKSLGIYKLK